MPHGTPTAPRSVPTAPPRRQKNLKYDAGLGRYDFTSLVWDTANQQFVRNADGTCQFYFPYLKSLDPIAGNVIELPPGGYVPGVHARTDNNVGVWKAPAGYETTLLNTPGVVDRGRMTDPCQGDLNVLAINCLRDFPGVGTVVFEAWAYLTHVLTQLPARGPGADLTDLLPDEWTCAQPVVLIDAG